MLAMLPNVTSIIFTFEIPLNILAELHSKINCSESADSLFFVHTFQYLLNVVQ